MKKLIRTAVIAASVFAAGASGAVTAAPPSQSFETLAGSAFTQSYSLTPVAANSLAISVTGLWDYYSALSFQILSGSGTLVSQTGINKSGQLTAAFNDPRNSSIDLAASAYTLVVSGQTRARDGLVSINLINGTIVPVPEPEIFGMMLAGLGMLIAIVRRRSKDKTL